MLPSSIGIAASRAVASASRASVAARSTLMRMLSSSTSIRWKRCCASYWTTIVARERDEADDRGGEEQEAVHHARQPVIGMQAGSSSASPKT